MAAVDLYPNGSSSAVRTPTVSAYDGFGGYHSYTADGLNYDVYNPVGFGGQFGYYKDYTGYYLLGHRYYDPRAGRFVTRDPIGYKGGINLYGFVGNNPVNESDPSGTDALDAERAISDNKKDIINVAKSNKIQPELLAGAVYAEVNAGGIPDGNAVSRQGSIQKFAIFGKGDFGMTKFHQFATDHPELKTYAQRFAWAEKRDADDHTSLVEAAGLLGHLARRRYGASSGNLSSNQIAIVLTEYNLGERSIRANASPNKEGRAYLAGQLGIRLLLSNGSAARRKSNSLNHIVGPGL